MARTLIIGDKTTRIVKEIVEKEIPTEEFLLELQKNSSIKIPFLPSNVRGFFSYKNQSGFIIEQQPRILSLQFENENTRGRVYNIPFPWAYYCVIIQNRPIVVQGVAISLAAKRVTDMKSKMGLLPFPNTEFHQSYGAICLGSVRVDDGLPFHTCVEDLVAKILGSEFNHDMFNNFSEESMPDVLWQQFSKMNATWINQNVSGKEYQDLVKQDVCHKYLYGWEHLGKEMKLKDFCDKLEFKTVGTYEDFFFHLTSKIGANNGEF